LFQITQKTQLNADTVSLWLHAPLAAAHAKAGQFIILRVNDTGERIPLTISDKNPETGDIRIIFQTVGKTTMLLCEKNIGDYISDIVGPLGLPTNLPKGTNFDPSVGADIIRPHIKASSKPNIQLTTNNYQLPTVCVIAGGLGTAIALPQVKELFSRGIDTHAILGFRNKDLIILEEEFTAKTHELTIATDDGSNGIKGFVTTILEDKINNGEKYDLVLCIGPIPMMKAVCELTKKFNIKTIVSMNSTMIDGTGMCGCCRVTVGGEVKFACVDGPDFDGHLVNFDEASRRSRFFREEEQISKEAHQCRLTNN